MLLVLVFLKLVEPDGHFAFKMVSDVHDSFTGSS
jgi:hypothetical protein